MNQKEDKPKKIILTYNIKDFFNLTNFHKSKGIAEAFFIAAFFNLANNILKFDENIAAAFFFILGSIYWFYAFTIKKQINSANWEEKELE